MLSFIKKHIFIILIFIFTLSVTFLTFLSFIGKSFILISDNNLKFIANMMVLNSTNSANESIQPPFPLPSWHSVGTI